MSNTNASAQPSLPRRKSRRRRDLALLVGLVLAVLVGLIGLAAATGWQEVLAQFSKLRWPEISVLLMLSMLNYLFRSVRWHMFSSRLALGTSLTQDVRHYLGGFAMTVTPGRVGELVRMRWLRLETGAPFEKTAPLMLGDRASDLTAMAVLLGGALALSSGHITGAIPVIIFALVAALVATRPRLLAAMAGFGYRVVGRWARLFARIRSAARSLAKFSDPMTMAVATLLGALGWFAEIYAFYLLLGWMGADIALTTATSIFIFSSLAGSLVGAPGGVGGVEAAMVALLTIEGIPIEISVPATAIIRFTTLWFAICVGLVVFPFAERISKKAAHALEKD